MFPIKTNTRPKSFPYINYLLVALNIALFIKELDVAYTGGFDKFIFTYGLIPKEFVIHPFQNIPHVFSSMFLHGSWGHVLSNMWFLLLFGGAVEDRLGHGRYFFYYLIVGIGAAMAQVLSHPASQIPMIGASGAVAGILGSYFVLYPRAKVLTVFIIIIFVRVVEIPALIYLGFWFLMQAFNGLGTLSHLARHTDIGGVAWWAHAGGFAMGFILVFFFRKRSR